MRVRERPCASRAIFSSISYNIFVNPITITWDQPLGLGDLVSPCAELMPQFPEAGTLFFVGNSAEPRSKPYPALSLRAARHARTNPCSARRCIQHRGWQFAGT